MFTYNQLFIQSLEIKERLRATSLEKENLETLRSDIAEKLQPLIDEKLLQDRCLSKFTWTSTAPPVACPGTFQIRADYRPNTEWNTAYADLQKLCGGDSWLHTFLLRPDLRKGGQIQFMDGDLYIVAPTVQRGLEICKEHGLTVNWSYLETLLSDQRRVLDEQVVLLEYFKHLHSK